MIFFLRPKNSGGVVRYSGKGYRGGIGFKRYPDSVLTVINYITMDNYLYGVLPKEMSGDWPLEALKAQAVAARNYAMVNFGKHSNHGFDICNTTDCQSMVDTTWKSQVRTKRLTKPQVNC